MSSPYTPQSANSQRSGGGASAGTVDPAYDPYIPQGPQKPLVPGQPQDRTAAIQAQIDDTVGIMRENISKVSKRGEQLNSLQDKTDNLAVSAQGFRRGANRVRKHMWWKDMKMRMCLIFGVVVLIIVVVVPVVVSTKH